jgi:hypothetical protein
MKRKSPNGKAGGLMTRRKFINTTAAAAATISIMPRHVLGGPGFIPPSDKIALAYIGCGTQGMREMTSLIAHPGVQIVAVCDANKFTTNYLDWSPNDIRDRIREALQDPDWGEHCLGIPGGRDIGKEFVDKYYGTGAALMRITVNCSKIRMISMRSRS